MPIIMMQTGPTQISDPKDRAGRLGELMVASAIIAFTLPLMAIVALAIKCDSSGPVFSREERVDARGRCFTALKFRCMVHHDELVGVTRVGRFLRYTRMDGLPQLVNVLRGEMSCINAGPEHLFFLD